MRSIYCLLIMMIGTVASAEPADILFRNTSSSPITSLRVCLGAGNCFDVPVACGPGGQCSVTIEVPDTFDRYGEYGVASPDGSVAMSSQNVLVYHECPSEPPVEPPLVSDFTSAERLDLNGNGLVELVEANYTTACAVNGVCP